MTIISAVIAAVLYLVGAVCFMYYGMFTSEYIIKVGGVPFPVKRTPKTVAKASWCVLLLGLTLTLGSFSVLFYW